MLESLSIYQLIFELLHDGRGNIDTNLEPIEVDALVETLRKRTGKDYGTNVDQWVEWFLKSEDVGTAREKSSIVTVKKIRDVEKESLRRLGKEAQ